MSDLTVPEAALTALRGRSAQVVDDQSIRVDAAWWNEHLTAAHASGPAIPAAEAGHHITLTREQLFAAGQGADQDSSAAFGLLWRALAWGAGPNLRLCAKRIAAASAQPAATGNLLVRAASLAAGDPKGAYQVLHDGGNAIPYLGPSFFTKYLYFAGGPTGACLILDRRVAHTLRALGWTNLATTNWSADTYARYCVLLREWATDPNTVAQLGRAVRPDEFEYWAFATSGSG